MQGLAGVRVLELGHMVSAAYAAKLMADLGAEVIKIEEPLGDVARQRGPFLVAHRIQKKVGCIWRSTPINEASHSICDSQTVKNGCDNS